MAKLQEELFEIRGETNLLNRDLTTKQEQLSVEQVLVARLRGDLSKIQGEFAATSQLSEVNEIVEGRLLAAQQELPVRDLQEMGYKIAVYALTLLNASIGAMQQTLACLKQGVPVPHLMDFHKLRQIVGFEAYDAELGRYHGRK